MKQSARVITALVASSFMLSACARNLSNDVYNSNATVGKVLYGRVLSAKPVTIKNTDRVQGNSTGLLAGGAAGAAAGSGIGKGSGKTMATVGGAIAGALLGSLLEEGLSTQEGTQYIVQLEGANSKTASTSTSHISLEAKDQVSSDINRSLAVASVQTDTISVVQDNKTQFSPGQRVMVIYSDDRARLQAITQ